MKLENKYPCSGPLYEDGCGVFEIYVKNELACMDNEGENNPARVLSEGDYASMREKLYVDFIKSNFCPLKKHDNLLAQLSVVAVFNVDQAQYGNCSPLLEVVKNKLN